MKILWILGLSGIALAGLKTEGETCNSELETVQDDEVDELLSIVPEGVMMNDYFTVDQRKSFEITSDMEGALIHLTFVHEGSAYKNKFGYFLFDDTIDDTGVEPFDETFNAAVEMKTIWDNASFFWSGGDSSCMTKGHTATIEVEAAWVGKSLGFWLQANGKDDEEGTYWFTEDHLNADGGQAHAVVIQTITDEDRLVMSWEDLYRTAEGTEDDFTDLVVDVETTPVEIVAQFVTGLSIKSVVGDADGDGVPDGLDDFPEDGTLAFNNTYPAGNRFYTVAFEDLYPAVGDGDYNDFVVSGRISELLNAENKIARLEGRFYTVARGAGYDHSFHLRIAGAGSGTWDITTYDEDGEVLGVESGSNTTDDLDLEMFASTQQAMPLYNTYIADRDALRQGHWVTWRFVPNQAIDPADLEQAPYDPYLHIIDTDKEVHQIGKSPVDISRAETDENYRNADGYPWVLVIPEGWQHPVEKVLIDDAYPEFTSWRGTLGDALGTWFRSPQDAEVINVDGTFFIHDAPPE